MLKNLTFQRLTSLIFSVFNAVYQGSVQGHQIALRYLREHIDSIHAHFGGQATYTFLNSIAGRIGNVGSRQEVTPTLWKFYARENN